MPNRQGTFDPTRDRILDDNYELHQIKRLLLDSTDAFGRQTSLNPSNRLGLPSFNPFTEERYRYIENGTRIQDPDTDSTRFTDQDKNFRIEPEAGDTIEFKSAEAPRYVPGFDAAASWALKFDTFLQDASDRFDLFVEGCYELRWFGDGTLELVTIEGGQDNIVKTATLSTAETSPLRPELTFNWYDVGRAEWTADYTDDDANQQLTDILGTLTDETDWLSDSPVGRLGFRLDVTNAGIQLEAGSMAYIPQADVKPTSRPKPFFLGSGEVNEIPADGYGVVGALRIDPGRDQIFTTTTQIEVEGEQGVDTELWLKAVPQGETDADFIDVRDDGSDAGPAYPRCMSPQNSVLQWTPNVSTFPTRTDAVSGATIPAGRLVGLAYEGSAGQGSGTTQRSLGFRRTRPIYPDDVVLMIGHTPDASTAQQIDVFGGTDQDF